MISPKIVKSKLSALNKPISSRVFFWSSDDDTCCSSRSLQSASSFPDEDDYISSLSFEISTSPQSPRPTQQKRKRRKTKRVRFSKRDQVRDTIHINDLKRLTDIRNIWYTEEETKAIVSSCQDMVQLIESGLPFDTHTECTRGLEGYVAREMKHRRQVAMEALLTVLEEQDLQRSEGVYNPELLADLYFFRSYQCGDAAHQVALQDEKDALA